jgi:hypothetical protein
MLSLPTTNFLIKLLKTLSETTGGGNGDLEPKPPPIEPCGGAMPLDSPFYVQRPIDAEFQTTIQRRDNIVLLKGPRQVGKTSLLARGLRQAREA